MKVQFYFFVSMMAGAALMASASVSLAQSTTNKSNAQAKPAANAKNAWLVTCGSAQTGNELVCRMAQNVIIAKTKQRLLSVVIQPDGKAKNHTMVVAMPHGLNIPKGVDLQVDELKARTVAIKTSDQNGTYASEPIDDVLLAALRKGDKLNVSYTFANGKKIRVPIGLRGFTAAYKKLTSN